MPQVYHAYRCGMHLHRPIVTSACAGREALYFFSGRHVSNQTCDHWSRATKAGISPSKLMSNMRAGDRDPRVQAGAIGPWVHGWQWAVGNDLLPGYPKSAWLPPPLHQHYQPLPLEEVLHDQHLHRQTSPAWQGHGIVFIANSCSQRGRGTGAPCLRLSFEEAILSEIRRRLLACGKRLIYVAPLDVGASAEGVGGQGAGEEGIARVFANAVASGQALVLSPRAHGGVQAFNEILLRAASKARCFITPGGGTSYLTHYMPGGKPGGGPFHTFTDRVVTASLVCSVLLSLLAVLQDCTWSRTCTGASAAGRAYARARGARGA